MVGPGLVPPERSSGRWVTEEVYAKLHSISRQTLNNWRYLDRKAGRRQAEAGYPQYRYFGAAVRYWVPSESE